MNTFPLNLGPDGAGDGRFYLTASGEWIPDGGAWQFQGYDENGLLRSLNGRLTGVHKVLCSAAEIACERRQDFNLGHDGGSDSQQNWSGNENSCLEIGELAWKERSHSSSKTTFSILSCEELSAVGKRGWQSSALVSPAKALNRDEAPIGDDFEPVGESRADVEMGNEEDEEPWKQKFTESE